MKNKKTIEVFNVITNEPEEGRVGEIFLYGVIGQDYWWDEKLDEESITDLAFTKALKRLEDKYDRINIRINSPGGSMYHGNAIISAMRNSKAEIHTYNDGLAASMAADIWVASENRHVASNSLLMFHAPLSCGCGNAKEMRKEADVLDKFAQTIVAVMARTTSMTEEEIKKEFYDDYEDHWLTADEAVEMGLVDKIEDDVTAALPDDSIQNRTLKEVFNIYGECAHDELCPVARAAASADPVQTHRRASLLTQLKGLFAKNITQQQGSGVKTHIRASDPNDPAKIKEMTIEDLKNSIADGTLTREEVLAAINEADENVVALQGQVTDLLDQVKALQDRLKAVEDSSAVPPAQVPPQDDPYAGLSEKEKAAQIKLEKANDIFVKEAAKG